MNVKSPFSSPQISNDLPYLIGRGFARPVNYTNLPGFSVSVDDDAVSDSKPVSPNESEQYVHIVRVRYIAEGNNFPSGYLESQGGGLIDSISRITGLTLRRVSHYDGDGRLESAKIKDGELVCFDRPTVINARVKKSSDPYQEHVHTFAFRRHSGLPVFEKALKDLMKQVSMFDLSWVLNDRGAEGITFCLDGSKGDKAFAALAKKYVAAAKKAALPDGLVSLNEDDGILRLSVSELAYLSQSLDRRTELERKGDNWQAEKLPRDAQETFRDELAKAKKKIHGLRGDKTTDYPPSRSPFAR